MPGEIQISYSTGATIYAIISDRIGQVWNANSGGSFAAYATASYAAYPVSMTELGTASHKYNGTFPAAIPAGIYGIDARKQAGGLPVETDVSIGTEQAFHWNGTASFPLTDIPVSGAIAGTIGQTKLQRGVMVQNFEFYLVSAADHITPFTSGVCSGQISRDGGAFGPLQSGTINEVGLGFYRCNLTSGDLNANTIGLVLSAVGISGGASDARPFSLVLQRSSGSA